MIKRAAIAIARHYAPTPASLDMVDERAGSWIGFYENGQLFYKGHYVEGKKDGLWVSYYDDATLFYQGNFEDGKENGLWKGFNPDGTPWAFRTGLFRNGIKISE